MLRTVVTVYLFDLINNEKMADFVMCCRSAVYTVWTLIFAVLNFRGLSIFAFFAFLFSRMRVPQYYIKYIDYMSVLICASHISHITKHVWAARRVGVAIAKQ